VIPVVPVVSGLEKNFLTVVAVDAAGNRSPVPDSAPDAPGTRQFRANPATGKRTANDATGDGLGDVAGLLDAGNGRTALVNLDTTPAGVALAEPLVTDPNAFPVARIVPVRGDFNGDGRADIAALRDEGGCRTTLWWWLSTGNGYVPSNGPLWDSLAPNWCLANSPKVVAGDFTGDGKSDLGAFYSYAGNQVKLWVWPARADGTGFGSSGLWWDSGPGNWEYGHLQAAAGDVDNDGDDDIVQLYDYNNCSSATIVMPSTRTAISGAFRTWRSADNVFCWARLSKPLIGDIDGDHRADVTAIYDLGNGTWEPITVYGADQTTVHVTGAHAATVPGRIKPVMADFTGDGLSDIGLLSNDGVGATSLWVTPQTGAADHSFGTETRRWDSASTIGGLSWPAFIPL
jgi:serralysin